MMMSGVFISSFCVFVVGEADFGDFTGLEQFLNSLDPSTGTPFQLSANQQGLMTSPSGATITGLGSAGAASILGSAGNNNKMSNNSAAALNAALFGGALDSTSAAALLNLQQPSTATLSGAGLNHSNAAAAAYHFFDPSNLNENIYNLSQFNVRNFESRVLSELVVFVHF